MTARPAKFWRPIIGELLTQFWPEFAARPDAVDWIEAQVEQESGGNPRALSPVGARGLLQLMPGTAIEVGVSDPYDGIQNLSGGIRYLRNQYRQLDEVPDQLQRLLWAFACYNAGRGYVDFNRDGVATTALELAKERAGREGHTAWWEWDFGKADFKRVEFKGRRPDWHQAVDYVDHIRRRFAAYQAAA